MCVCVCVMFINLWFGGPTMWLCVPTMQLRVLFNLGAYLINAGLTLHTGSLCPHTIMCVVYEGGTPYNHGTHLVVIILFV